MPGTIYEFGEFHLDCGRFELLRAGQSLRLERKPLELLILLAEKNGQLATREEIAQRLWQSEVFVDTEHGINTAIRKIRHVLRDDAEESRYIQTVTGKGYRFLAPLRVVASEGSSANSAPQLAASQSPPAPKGVSLATPNESPVASSAATQSLPQGFRIYRRARLVIVSAAALAWEHGSWPAVVRWQLRHDLERQKKEYVSPVVLAGYHAQLLETEPTLSLLEEGFRRHSIDILWITMDPAFDFLDSDPRFQSILQRINLPVTSLANHSH